MNIIRLASPIGAIALWWILALANQTAGWVPAALIPTPPQIVMAGWGLRHVIPGDITMSMLRVLEGFAITAVFGVLLGCLCGSSRLAESIFDPIMELLRPIPTLALLPLFIVWFGLGETSKVLIIAYASFFVVYVNTYQGVRYADPLLKRAALSLGANRVQTFFTIGLPSAMPEIFTGLKLGLGVAFVVLVAAELIAADSGMGYRIQEARYQFRVDRMFFGAALIGVIGFILMTVLKWIEDRVLAWKPQELDR